MYRHLLRVGVAFVAALALVAPASALAATSSTIGLTGATSAESLNVMDPATGAEITSLSGNGVLTSAANGGTAPTQTTLVQDNAFQTQVATVNSNYTLTFTMDPESTTNATTVDGDYPLAMYFYPGALDTLTGCPEGQDAMSGAGFKGVLATSAFASGVALQSACGATVYGSGVSQNGSNGADSQYLELAGIPKSNGSVNWAIGFANCFLAAAPSTSSTATCAVPANASGAAYGGGFSITAS